MLDISSPPQPIRVRVHELTQDHRSEMEMLDSYV